jgi:hypothetical protein
MKKIFKEGQKFDPMLYPESYSVYYHDEAGKRRCEVYYAASKNAHKQVASTWRANHTKQDVLINVNYQ